METNMTNQWVRRIFRGKNDFGGYLTTVLLGEPALFKEIVGSAKESGLLLQTILDLWLSLPLLSLCARAAITFFYSDQVTLNDLRPHLLSKESEISTQAKSLILVLLDGKEWERKYREDMEAFKGKEKRLYRIITMLLLQKEAARQHRHFDEEAVIYSTDHYLLGFPFESLGGAPLVV